MDKDSDGEGSAVVLLKSLEARIAALEDGEKSPVRRIAQNASLSALFLGLVLSVISLYDVLVTKPEADRIERISKFNQAVNSAARTRQEMLRMQMETADPSLRIAMSAAATPQILNDISTARAILRNLDDEDVEIPQLIVLMTESFMSNDMASAGDFVARAVSKENVPPSLRSEAMRYQGKYFFAVGNPVAGRLAYQQSLDLLGQAPQASAARAYVLEDWTMFEFAVGDCAIANNNLATFAASLGSPHIPPSARAEMAASLKAQLVALQNQHCQTPPDIDQILPDALGIQIP